MRKANTLVLGALLAISLLALTAGSASASNGVECSPRESCERITNTGLLTFTDSFGLVEVVCGVTKILSIHRSIPKTEGALVGYVREIRIQNPCLQNESWILTTEGGTPVKNANPNWHITFRGFTGTLPNILTITLLIRDARFLIRTGNVGCLYREGFGNAIVRGGEVREVRVEENERSSVRRLEGICPTGHLSGLLTLTPAVRIRLI